MAVDHLFATSKIITLENEYIKLVFCIYANFVSQQLDTFVRLINYISTFN